MSHITGWGSVPYSTRPAEGDRAALAPTSAKKIKNHNEKADRFTREDMQTEMQLQRWEEACGGGAQPRMRAGRRMFYEALNIYFSCVSICRVY